MADSESPERMQAANPGTAALHGPISPEPTSISSQTVHPEYIDADDTPSPAEDPASGVDGITVLGISLTNREITEQLGGDRWIGDNLIEIRVQLMNLLLHRNLGLQRRVWPFTLWRKKSLPQKENFFDFDWFILVCGEQGPCFAISTNMAKPFSWLRAACQAVKMQRIMSGAAGVDKGNRLCPPDFVQ